MSWISLLNNPGHITEAIIHFNEAIDSLKKRRANVEVSRYFFDSLNKMQTEWLIHQDEQDLSETKAFQTMILMGMDAEASTDLMNSKELRNFILFNPQIMNHDTLRKHHYKPDQEIEPSLVKKASEEHHKLVNAYEKYLAEKNEEVRERVIKRVAELLYVIRSNIAHGEKTPYGPDLKKRERDEKVCKVVVPLQRLLLNLLFDYPDKKLVVYGTLAPGNVNHDILSSLHGTWNACTVNGHVNEINGLPLFAWQPQEPSLNAQLFTSAILPSKWDWLDQFEGPDYRRILVPIVISNGMSIANIYVTVHDSGAEKWQY